MSKFKNPLDKIADKLLYKSKKGEDLKKFNIDLSGILGEGIDYKELQNNENKKLIGLTKTCLMNKLHFWINKTNGDHSSRINYIERDIKIAHNICEHINQNIHTDNDVLQLKNILIKHNCI
jgi:hypothetical protein